VATLVAERLMIVAAQSLRLVVKLDMHMVAKLTEAMQVIVDDSAKAIEKLVSRHCLNNVVEALDLGVGNSADFTAQPLVVVAREQAMGSAAEQNVGFDPAAGGLATAGRQRLLRLSRRPEQLRGVESIPLPRRAHLAAHAAAAQSETSHDVDRMRKLADDWLPAPPILHPWSDQRFAVNNSRWEPRA
jgi:hypothetical protein